MKQSVASVQASGTKKNWSSHAIYMVYGVYKPIYWV